MLRAYGRTDKGRVRQTNEDALGIDERQQLLVVADGMGGGGGGDVAARLAVDAVIRYVCRESPAWNPRQLWPFGYDPSVSDVANVLRTSVHLADARIREASKTTPALRGMGTTVVAALVHGTKLAVAHVGDSRFYLRSGDGVRCLTLDDSWLASVLASNPGAEPAALRDHPMRHAITNVVGVEPPARVHVTEALLFGGELLVLTTDGVHDVLDDDQIARVVEGGKSLSQIADGLVRRALESGSHDNCTSLVGQYFPN